MYLARVACGAKVREIAVAAGVAHNVVQYGLARIEDRRDDPAFDQLLDDLERELRAWVS